jgi:hypothetical protein
MIFRSEPVLLEAESPILRVAPRPPELRQPGYEEQFDYRTLIYDAVREPSGQVRLISPPLAGIARHLSIRSTDGHPLEFTIHRIGKVAETLLPNVPDDVEFIIMSVADRDYRVHIRRTPDLTYFEGLPVLLGISRNNALDWIADWAEFHAHVHGIRGLLLFDNGSTDYDVDELHGRLSQVRGIERLCVVDWPVKWGPMRGPHKEDSNFCQGGALAVARWRFLQAALTVTQCDIDELVVPLKSGVTLPEACLESSTGVLLFEGRRLVAARNHPTPVGNPGRRHRDYHYLLTTQPKRTRLGMLVRGLKWTIDPRRRPDVAQWRIHNIQGVTVGEALTRDFEFRHVDEITTGWKRASAKGRFNRYSPDDPRLSLDRNVVSLFEALGW